MKVIERIYIHVYIMEDIFSYWFISIYVSSIVYNTRWLWDLWTLLDRSHDLLRDVGHCRMITLGPKERDRIEKLTFVDARRACVEMGLYTAQNLSLLSCAVFYLHSTWESALLLFLDHCPSSPQNISIGEPISYKYRPNIRGMWLKDPKPVNDSVKTRIYETRHYSSSSERLYSWQSLDDYEHSSFITRY